MWVQWALLSTRALTTVLKPDLVPTGVSRRRRRLLDKKLDGSSLPALPSRPKPLCQPVPYVQPYQASGSAEMQLRVWPDLLDCDRIVSQCTTTITRTRHDHDHHTLFVFVSVWPVAYCRLKDPLHLQASLSSGQERHTWIRALTPSREWHSGWDPEPDSAALSKSSLHSWWDVRWLVWC